jgi:signal transduction histidine kinase
VHAGTDAEVLGLRAALRDLVALSAIPAAWVGSEPEAVAAGLADALLGLLQLDFAYVRLSDPGGAEAVEVTRGSAWKGFPEWLDGRLATSAPFPRKEIIADARDDSARRRRVAVPVGVNGEGGVVAAASERVDFPTDVDQLLLSLAANHAAAAFQNARLIHERKRAEEALRRARNDLEVRVAERTSELGVANDALSALRRVATLAAEGVQPQDLFAVVAEEIARVIDVPLVAIVRYEPDGTATECAGFSIEGPRAPFGTQSSLEGMNLLRLVQESSEAARIDDYSGLQGEIAESARRRGIRSSVGTPIVVAGRVWGAVIVSTTDEEPLADDIEVRLADFTELVATAIENAESRGALERLADEQAALRRVATLVAQGVPPSEIFSAVSREVQRMLGLAGETLDVATVVRFDPGPEFVLVGAATTIEGFPLGSRWGPDDLYASTRVFRTGCSARVDESDPVSIAGPEAATLGRHGLISQVASPIVVEGQVWGAMTVNAKEALPSDTEERLEKFTELLGTAIANAEGKSELAASRRRIVAASDEARARIERDLHDGTQQRLASLGLAVSAAEAAVPPDMGDLRADLSRIGTGLANAIAELQEISRGIHPAILSHGGLGPALRALGRRSMIPVALDITTDTRVPEPVEVAAYFVASEALANATKHSQASRIDISLALRNGTLLLSVRDDGVGGAITGHGSGLVGLQDRVEALGGTIGVESPPGGGTSVLVMLPTDRTADATAEEVVDSSGGGSGDRHAAPVIRGRTRPDS